MTQRESISLELVCQVARATKEARTASCTGAPRVSYRLEQMICMGFGGDRLLYIHI